MNNSRLSRDTDNLKSGLDGVINQLISEIEELEEDKNKMQDEIDSLKETIEKMSERISELKSS